MAYKFAKQSEVKELERWCMEILHAVQKEVREYFTFDIRLVGSGNKRLVTQNGDEAFDLDYNIILQKDKKGLLNEPKRIKEIFVAGFNKVLKTRVSDYTHASDSTSVITAKIVNANCLTFSFDVAIIVECDDGCFYRLMHDKQTDRCFWNQVTHSENYFERFKAVKENGCWLQFKKRYLELKNIHLSRQDGVKSFSIFLETLNEFRG